MPPIRLGDGTRINPKGIQAVRKGDGRIIFTAGTDFLTPDPEYQFDARELDDHEDGDTVTEWPDTSEGGTLSGSGTFRENGIDGIPAVEYDSTQEEGHSSDLETLNDRPTAIIAVAEVDEMPGELHRIASDAASGDNNMAVQVRDGWEAFAGGSGFEGTRETGYRLLSTIHRGYDDYCVLRENGIERQVDGLNETESNDGGIEVMSIGFTDAEDGFHFDGKISFVEAHNDISEAELARREREIVDDLGIDIELPTQDDSAVFQSAHSHNYVPDLYPGAVHSDDTTYISAQLWSGEGDGSAHAIRSYDESSGDWSDWHIIDGDNADLHCGPALAADDEGNIHAVYSSSHSNNSETDHTVSPTVSDWTAGSPHPVRQSYRHLFWIDDELVALARNSEDQTPRPLMVTKTSDGGGSWESTDVITIDDRAIYQRTAEREGAKIHVSCMNREWTDTGSGPAKELLYATINTDTETITGPTGDTESAPVSSLSTLDDIGSLIEDEGHVDGAGFGLDDGTPVVAYVHDPGESGDYDLVFARWDSNAEEWTKTTVEENIPTSGSVPWFAGENIWLEIDGGDEYTIYETNWMTEGEEKSLGRWETSDGGDSWTNRQVEREFLDLEYGLRFVQRVKNGSEIKYVGVEETDPSESEAGGGRVWAFDEDWNKIG